MIHFISGGFIGLVFVLFFASWRSHTSCGAFRLRNSVQPLL